MCSVIVLRSVGLLQNQASLPTRHVQQLQWSNGVPWLHQSSGYLHKARLSQAPIPYLLFKIILRITVIPYLQKPSHLFYVRPRPPNNDQKWEPIYLFLFSRKSGTQYIYFATIFLNILGPDFVSILGPRLFT